MYSKIALIAVPGLFLTFAAHADTDRTYVQIIIKACPALEQTGQDHRPEAVTGYYVDPINQGLSYNDERSPTKEEREAFFATQHCIDVPIPAEVTTGGQVSIGNDPGPMHEPPWLYQRDAVPRNEPCIQKQLSRRRRVGVRGATIRSVGCGGYVARPPRDAGARQ